MNNFPGHNGRPTHVRFNANRNTKFCRFCDVQGHDTKFCHKLAKFIKENNITLESQHAVTMQSLAINATIAFTVSQQPWVMDIGASYHTMSNSATM